MHYCGMQCICEQDDLQAALHFILILQRSANAPAVLHAANIKDAYTCSHCLQDSHW